VIIRVEEDDHGHATLLVHGEPEIIQEVALAVTLLLAADADQVFLPDAAEVDEQQDEEDIASSS
jgi:hypothetical protein